MRAVLIGFFLSSAFLTVGCKQGNGNRCVQDSDCSSGICVGASVQGGHCAASTTNETGTGGSTSTGGQTGSGGEAGQGGGGAGGSDSDASPSDGAPSRDDAASAPTDAAGGP